jgi:hypothetical protein
MRPVAEEQAGDHRRDDGRDDDGAERGDREVPEDDLDREERSGDRPVEGGGNPGCGSAAHQGP